MRLAWHAIVRNEAAIIGRAIRSLLLHVDCALVTDTGSTDDTVMLIQQAFAAAGKPVEVAHTAFVDFSQARNEALLHARMSSLEWDYLLLSDADMVLQVTDPLWAKQLNGGLAYDVKQVAGGLGYWNRRLLHRSAECSYEGPTHEYLDIEAAGRLAGLHFRDRADGFNRPGKFARDIALLENALKTETRPGHIERYTFYLAASYYDAGDFGRAALHYGRRAAMGGFDEEQWYAQMRYALCLGHLGDRSGFIREMLRAYELRPTRAEPLYELAKHFRLQGDNHTSLLFSEAGMQLKKPDDLLFVNDWVYTHGLKEEYAICGYYSERHRRTAAKEANRLALAGSIQARGNMYWYLQPLGEVVPSFQPLWISFEPPAGYVAMNPSVTSQGGKPVMLVRTVNYTITPEGQYAIQGATGDRSPHNAIDTRNYLVSDSVQRELKLPENWPEPKYTMVRGFEDSRLFEWGGELWTLSTVRELTPEGWCEQVLAPIDGYRYGSDWSVIRPKERRHEKNWMLWVGRAGRYSDLCFVYRLGTLVDTAGDVVFHDPPDFDVSNISGGSQVIQLDSRTWVALVHEAHTIPGRPHNRYYSHRFVSFRSSGKVDRLSPPFFFHDKQIEFCAGMALIGKQLMISYGIRDAEAWTATLDPDDVIKFIYKDTL